MSRNSGLEGQRSGLDRLKKVAVLAPAIAGFALSACGGIEAVPSTEKPPTSAGQNPGGGNSNETDPSSTTSVEETPQLIQIELDPDSQYIPTTLPVEGDLNDRTTEELSRIAGYWETEGVDDAEVVDGLITSTTYYADNIVWTLQRVAKEYDLNLVDIDHLLGQLEVSYFTDDKDSEAATVVRKFMIETYYKQLDTAHKLGVDNEKDPLEQFAQICPTVFDEDVFNYTMCSPTSGEPYLGDEAGPSSLFFEEVKEVGVDEAASVHLTIDVWNNKLPGDSGSETHSVASLKLPETTIAKGDKGQLIFVDK